MSKPLVSRNGSTYAWRRRREAVLKRDRYTCQWNGPRCNGRGETAGHIVARRHGGTDEMDNLAAQCWPCQQDEPSVEAGRFLSRGTLTDSALSLLSPQKESSFSVSGNRTIFGRRR